MRTTSVWAVECLCGAKLEWPDASRETTCGACGRVVAVGQWPNVDLTVVAAESAGVQ